MNPTANQDEHDFHVCITTVDTTLFLHCVTHEWSENLGKFPTLQDIQRAVDAHVDEKMENR